VVSPLGAALPLDLQRASEVVLQSFRPHEGGEPGAVPVVRDRGRQRGAADPAQGLSALEHRVGPLTWPAPSCVGGVGCTWLRDKRWRYPVSRLARRRRCGRSTSVDCNHDHDLRL
jgi:hypothetical protein